MDDRKFSGHPYLQNGKQAELCAKSAMLSKGKITKGLPSFSEVIYF